MDFSSIGTFTLVTLLVGYIGYERTIQQAAPGMDRRKMYDKDQMEQAFINIREEEYGDKSREEFQIALALISLLDMLDNPEEYPNNVMAFVLDNADAWAEYARMKYDEEIKALENEDVGNTSNG